MTLTIRETGPDEIEALIPILRQKEETERALRWSLANLSDAVYRMDDDGQLVGAATMQWRGDGCEMMELANCAGAPRAGSRETPGRLADRRGAAARRAPDAGRHRK